MLHTIEEYRTLVAKLPQAAKDAVKGKTWVEQSVWHALTSERIPARRTTSPHDLTGLACYCPMGLALDEAISDRFVGGSPTGYEIARWLSSAGLLPDGSAPGDVVPIAWNFANDWDTGAMTIEEMEDIFA